MTKALKRVVFLSGIRMTYGKNKKTLYYGKRKLALFRLKQTPATTGKPKRPEEVNRHTKKKKKKEKKRRTLNMPHIDFLRGTKII